MEKRSAIDWHFYLSNWLPGNMPDVGRVGPRYAQRAGKRRLV
jgi:hypothetical protein